MYLHSSLGGSYVWSERNFASSFTTFITFISTTIIIIIIIIKCLVYITWNPTQQNAVTKALPFQHLAPPSTTSASKQSHLLTYTRLPSASEMTYIVSGGALNSTHSLTALLIKSVVKQRQVLTETEHKLNGSKLLRKNECSFVLRGPAVPRVTSIVCTAKAWHHQTSHQHNNRDNDNNCDDNKCNDNRQCATDLDA